jgi:hypothetical protein
VNSLLSVAIGLTRAWASVYTRGLPAAMRSARREEIDCDLWEHQRLADFERESATGTAAAILLRLIAGMPADVLWRLEAGSTASERGTRMNESILQRGLLGLAILVALFPVGLGVTAVIGVNGEWDNDTERIVVGLLWVFVGCAMIAGLILSRSRPILGIGLVLGGAVTLSAMWYWIAVITLPIGLGLAAIAFFRARQSGWPRGVRTA